MLEDAGVSVESQAKWASAKIVYPDNVFGSKPEGSMISLKDLTKSSPEDGLQGGEIRMQEEEKMRNKKLLETT